MPLYSLTSTDNISDTKKKKLVNLFTDAHCNIMIAPEQFVHVLFTDGIPLLENKSLYVHANVRKGRDQNKIKTLCEVITKECAQILDVSQDKIHINLAEIEAKWCMEGGYIMPDPGEEDEWIEKVTNALANRKTSLLE